MSPEDVIYTGTDGNWHFSPYSYRCLVKMEDINHQSRVVTDSNYMFTVHWLFSVGLGLNRFPSGWGTEAQAGETLLLWEITHFIKSCYQGVHLVESIPAFHRLDFHPCRRSKQQMRSFITSTAQLYTLLLSRVHPCLIDQMVQVLTL